MFCRSLRGLSVFSSNTCRLQSTSAMYKRLDGKVAVVTASTEGIGFAIARRLAQDGAKVVVSSRRKKNVEKAVKQLQSEDLDVHGLVCHVGKAEDRHRLVEETTKTYGGIDILVNNAGMNASFGPLLDTPEDKWDKIFDINVKAGFYLTSEVVPHIEKRGGGSVVFVSSITGLSPMPMIGAYSISKTAILGMVKALAPELGAMNIRVNCICPGIIKTHFSQALTANDYILEETLKQTPLKRLGTPEDCSGVVSFLVSEDAAYITGENIANAGGMHSRL